MHAAPPVRVILGRSAGGDGLVCLAVGLAAANMVAWVLLHNEAPPAVAVVVGLIAAALAAWQMQRSPAPADLFWNGAEWQWQGSAGNVLVALDFDAWMLLRFESVQGERSWIAASRATAQGPWPALRAALYARRPADPLSP